MLPASTQERLLDNLNTAVLVLNDDLCVSYSNSAAEMLLEISEQRALGTSINSLLVDQVSTLIGLQECLRTGYSYTQREAEFLLPSGSRLSVDYTVVPISDNGYSFILMEIQARDRLLRISREEELLAKQETSRILVRGLAHEIKNPLGGIRGAAQLLDKELKEEGLHDYTSIIIAEADRLRNLVDRMLGPNQTFKQDPTNIHEVLERVVSLIEVESHGKVRLVKDYDPSLPEFPGDKEQLIQAFLNIARNALQALEAAAPPVESPEIIFRTRPLRQITIGHTRHRLVLRVDIIDNGPGIPPDFLKNIFYPMVSGRAQGTGLGLSITQSIIGQHHGLVECESEAGRTNFIIYIPLEPTL
ncbi:two-component system sensor histidine kinase NtrB [Hahella sp. CCB-MM4]|uniref:nitrogen regulation protein NR(II) n=1 Tax=Hahella sp. (strain CCB-MM4) TaxID=1926491 RepID=UPI000B9BC999|nr:nitrogen regulation protein NR(II) [Hahella sp. CCB-MM4]OZG74935.1 two-component system sensor histidine kinase NtrB [Hahella sp. CCB-MM4]